MIEPKKFLIGTDGDFAYYVEAVNMKQALLKFAEYVGVSDMEMLKKYYGYFTQQDMIKFINRISSTAIMSVMEISKMIYSGANYGYSIMVID